MNHCQHNIANGDECVRCENLRLMGIIGALHAQIPNVDDAIPIPEIKTGYIVSHTMSDRDVWTRVWCDDQAAALKVMQRWDGERIEIERVTYLRRGYVEPFR